MSYSIGFNTSKEPACKGERKDLWEVIDKMTPAQRKTTITECCQLAKRGRPYLTDDSTGSVQECYNDLTLLTTMHGVSWQEINDKALEVMKRRD